VKTKTDRTARPWWAADLGDDLRDRAGDGLRRRPPGQLARHLGCRGRTNPRSAGAELRSCTRSREREARTWLSARPPISDLATAWSPKSGRARCGFSSVDAIVCERHPCQAVARSGCEPASTEAQLTGDPGRRCSPVRCRPSG
jgi:hypothetical protein